MPRAAKKGGGKKIETVPVPVPEEKPAAPVPVKFGGAHDKPGRTGSERGHIKPTRQLRDMRWVYGHDEKEDRTEGRKRCRALLRQGMEKFMTVLERLEKDFREADHRARERYARRKAVKDAKAAPAAAAKADPGTERCRELIDLLLAEWLDRKKKSGDAVIAPTPGER